MYSKKQKTKKNQTKTERNFGQHCYQGTVFNSLLPRFLFNMNFKIVVFYYVDECQNSKLKCKIVENL